MGFASSFPEKPPVEAVKESEERETIGVSEKG